MAWNVNGIRLVEAHLSVYNAIKRLAKKQGYCTAWNEQIGNDWMVNKSADRVSHIITDLRRAGLVSVLCIYEKGRNFVKMRKLAIVGDFLKAVNPRLSSIATKTDTLSGTDNKKTTEPKKAPMKTLMETAMKLGIGWQRVLFAIKIHGLKYVQEKMAVVANSRSLTNPVGYFIAALNNDYKPNKRAARKVGMPCDYERKAVYTVNYQNHEADASIKTRSLSEIASDPSSSWLAKYIH